MTRPAHRYYVCAGLIAIVGYFLLPLAGVPPVFRVAWYFVISASAAVAVAAGIRRHRPRVRAPWWCLVVGQALYAAADVVFYLCRQVLGIDAFPYYDDVLYLASYPLLAIGLLLFVRARTPGWDVASLIDSLIIAVVAGLLLWTYLVRDVAVQPGEGILARCTSVAYPAMDLLLLTVGVRLALGAASRVAVYGFLYIALVLMLGADISYGLLELTGGYVPGGVLEGIWLLVAVSLGAAGLHPSMRVLTQRRPSGAVPDTSAVRLVLLAMASTCAPALLLVEHLRGVEPDVVPAALACMALFPLTLARMATMVAAQRRMATTDPLTTLRTRRYLDERLAREVARARRSGRPLGLLMIDVDHFKRINDTYGHGAGDLALAQVGEVLRHCLRPGDLVARYGGEEFAALLSDVDPHGIVELAERVRLAVATAPITVVEGMPLLVTVSVGAACIPEHALDGGDLVRAADRALYAAKHEGRNRTCLSGSGAAAVPAAA
jgi:diguanylate cyclase (GGDEF)-like protein